MVSTRIRSLTRWSPGTVAISLSLLSVTPFGRHHGKRGELLGTRCTLHDQVEIGAAGLACCELPHHTSRGRCRLSRWLTQRGASLPDPRSVALWSMSAPTRRWAQAG